MVSQTTAETAGAGPVDTTTSTRRWTLAIACVATFMLTLDLTVVNVALYPMRSSLGASFSDLQWVIDAYALTLAAFLLTAGSLADRLGRKRVFALGLVIFTLASLAAGAAQDIVAVQIARAMQGVGGAVMFAVAPALIGQEFRGKDRGKAFGIFGGITGLALAFGPLVGGALTDGLSWRWVFLANIPIGAFLLAASLVKLRESHEPRPHPIDWPGIITFGAALTLIVFGFLRGETEGWSSATIIFVFLSGIVLLVAFAFVQRAKGPAAMLDPALFRVTTFKGISAATFLSNATSLAALFLMVSYLQNVLNYSPLETGLRLLPLTLVLFVVAAITGAALVNTVAPGVLIGTSIALIAAGMGLIALVDAGSAWTALLPAMVVMGVGMGIFNPPRATVSIGVAEPAKAGMAAGIGETFQQVGIAVGIAAFGALFQSRVVDGFVSSDVGAQLGEQAETIGRLTAAGGGNRATTEVPPALAERVSELSQSAFVSAFTEVAVVCAVVCAVGAVIAFAFIHRRDLHESALEGGDLAPKSGGAAASIETPPSAPWAPSPVRSSSRTPSTSRERP